MLVSLARIRDSRLVETLSGWPRRLAAVGCLALAALAAVSAPRAGAAGPTSEVVVAARDIQPGSVLGPGDLRTVVAPADVVPPTALRAASAAIGHSVAGLLSKGEPLTPGRLLDTGISGSLRPGQVAVAITLPSHGQADILKPGATIDLYLGATSTLVDGAPVIAGVDPTGTTGSGGSAAEKAAAGRRLLSGLRVLSVLPTSPDDSTSGVSVVVATDTDGAQLLAAHLAGPFLATLAPTG